MLRNRKRLPLVALAALFVVACGSDDDSTSDSTAASASTNAVPATTAAPATSAAPTTTEPEATVPTTDSVPTEPGFSVAALLAEIADDLRPAESPLLIVAGDLDLASQMSGVERPPASDPGDVDALVDWLNPLTGLAREGEPLPIVASQLPAAVVKEQLLSNAEIAGEFGWSVLDVGQFIELQNPPNSFAVLEVGVTDEELTSAIDEPTDGVWRLGPEEDGAIDIATRTVARPIGESLRFGLADGWLAVSRYTAPVVDWLAGPSPTLADDEQLLAVAAALDDAGVYSAMLVGAEPEDSSAPAADQPVLGPFEYLGIGLGVADGRPQATFVYQHGSAEEAEANVERVRTVFEEGESFVNGRPLAEMFTVEDVVADGQTVIATVTFADDVNPTTAWRMVAARDLPTAHA